MYFSCAVNRIEPVCWIFLCMSPAVMFSWPELQDTSRRIFSNQAVCVWVDVFWTLNLEPPTLMENQILVFLLVPFSPWANTSMLSLWTFLVCYQPQAALFVTWDIYHEQTFIFLWVCVRVRVRVCVCAVVSLTWNFSPLHSYTLFWQD